MGEMQHHSLKEKKAGQMGPLGQSFILHVGLLHIIAVQLSEVLERGRRRQTPLNGL